MSAVLLNPKMAPIVADLAAKSNGRYDIEFLRILVANVANEFEGARVQDYVEVLVAKQAADELRRLDALTPLTA
jgi:hypothetical protein